VPSTKATPPATSSPARTAPRSGASLRPPWKAGRIRVVKRTRTSVTLKWRPSARADRYVLSVRRTNKTGWQRRGSTSSTRFTVARLSRKTLHTIRVVARNQSGGSPPALIRVKTR
jgi:hypothetical protein